MTTPFPFVAAQVLTASELNSIKNLPSSTKTANYVLTIANVGSRVVMNAAGSTTITVNTSIFSAGDIVELSNIGAGVCTVTAGTATVSSAGPLAIPQYGGGRLVFSSASAAIYYPSAVTVAAPAASGLTKLLSGTATAATQISFTNIFSATYKNYRVILSNIANAQDNNKILLFVGTGGTPEVHGTDYVSGQIRGYGTTTLNYFRGDSDFYLNGNMGTTNNFVIFDLLNPQVAKYTMLKSSSLGTYSAHVFTANDTYGQIKTTTQYTDMFFKNDSATNIGAIDYAIYGYEA